jgi:hypothetical protein
LTGGEAAATVWLLSGDLPVVRQTVLRLVVLGALGGVGAWSVGPMPACVAEEVADLTDRLTTGLRVRDPDDVAFCERVAWLVRQGRLPAGLVDSTYTWAIERGRKHPFPAFQHVIRLQAAKLGVPL